eukprot:796323-Prymnesium_polylepis.1
MYISSAALERPHTAKSFSRGVPAQSRDFYAAGGMRSVPRLTEAPKTPLQHHPRSAADAQTLRQRNAALQLRADTDRVTLHALQHQTEVLEEQIRRLQWERDEEKHRNSKLLQRLSLFEGSQQDLQRGTMPLNASQVGAISGVVTESLNATRAALEVTRMHEHNYNPDIDAEGRSSKCWTVASWLTSPEIGATELIAKAFLGRLRSAEATMGNMGSTAGASELRKPRSPILPSTRVRAAALASTLANAGWCRTDGGGRDAS